LGRGNRAARREYQARGKRWALLEILLGAMKRTQEKIPAAA